MQLDIQPIKTKVFLPPQDDLYAELNAVLPPLKERDVLLITSKVLAIHQGRCVRITDAKKDDLIIAEAESYIPRSEIPNAAVIMTLKENILIPSAGIDESNANGYYILWPKNSNAAAKEICLRLKAKYNLKEFAVIITDSRTTPLRYGTLGISLGFFGLEPINDYRGTPDLFGRTLQITTTNVVDTLAVMGVAVMGEGKEQTPIALVRGADFVTFTDEDSYDKLIIPRDLDIYTPLFKNFTKKES